MNSHSYDRYYYVPAAKAAAYSLIHLRRFA